MKVLTRNSLPLGGFGGLTEHRLVTDSRLFGNHKSPNTFEGLGQFVYLADAKFNPFGDTTMHPHKEIDVITVMLEGEVTHEGSLEHGKSLKAGETQVQRAGGEGFSHNEINPNNSQNRLLQIWALPEEFGRPAAYKHYNPKGIGVTHIYGGDKTQTDTFDSTTHMHIVKLQAGQTYHTEGKTMVYVYQGELKLSEGDEQILALDGTLVRAEKISITAITYSECIVITKS
ncbi:pirin family protein [Pseudoalteromonas sp. SSM20]|uniref:pirin family protein n=1 Tax=Pseudoalteromonas sp. SSM20 TaxID=3139394 RepID=UPI003BA89E15